MSDFLIKLYRSNKNVVLMVSLILQMVIISSSQADVLYIGDTTFNEVASDLQNKSSEYQEYGKLLDYTRRGAGISNYSDWLYSSTEVQASADIQAVIISLGIVDFHQSRKHRYQKPIPSDSDLDRGIYEILQQLEPGTPVFWILPHAYMPDSDTEKEIWQRVVNAIVRAYTSGDWPSLYVVNLEEWAMYSEVTFTDLLDRKQRGFSRSGASTVADFVIYYLHNPLNLSS